MNLNGLSWPTKHLHTSTRNGSTWGYVIYRTTFTPHSNAAFLRIVDLLNSYMKHGLCSECVSSGNNTPTKTELTFYHELWAQHSSVIMNHPRFDRASIDSVRVHFRRWVDTQENQGLSTQYRMCMVIDEESLQTLLDTPPPQECSDEKLIDPTRHVKVVPLLPYSDDEIDELDGFMGG
ncbi:hypothetical protein Pdw03_8917 [Penicillium digitatum]|uniref:Uncharacterized protein n=3 Tax=Penicillium digitatum TaxID=36651 RepID=K9FAX2_PEND2|nr:hypothetical protein PDIP_22440 [Penicillium digitatum Pd1]EKV05212.1 hypothetical protein PDIG_84780 [Penicillium digitatum PHI26]EKV19649.1 hypothetical protein PDIP_22440 [Penicillium digitatum Pd1]KAG0156662.1 hypothetical protein PDIDSM_3843 [Penicillium digitatum]QQK45016.1 hypothetical protein Pdw03_8917 [Penicillium digitatum]